MSKSDDVKKALREYDAAMARAMAGGKELTDADREAAMGAALSSAPVAPEPTLSIGEARERAASRTKAIGSRYGHRRF